MPRTSARLSIGRVSTRSSWRGLGCWLSCLPSVRPNCMTASGAARRRAPRTVLRPFFRYLDRCTTEDHRLFLGGLIPEVGIWREAICGRWIRTLQLQLAGESTTCGRAPPRPVVPFALIPSGGDTELVGSADRGRLSPRTLRFARRFFVDGNEHVEILIDNDLPSVSRDRQRGGRASQGRPHHERPFVGADTCRPRHTRRRDPLPHSHAAETFEIGTACCSVNKTMIQGRVDRRIRVCHRHPCYSDGS